MKKPVNSPYLPYGTLEIGIPNSTVGAAFVSAVMEGGKNPAPAQDGAYAVAFIEAAYRSAEEGRIINIEYPLGR